MQTLLAWLPLLICPLMMLFCMLPMLRKKGKCATGKTADLSPHQAQARLAELRQEERALLERIADERPGPLAAAPQPSVAD